MLRTLGEGAFSKVKLAYNVEDKHYYAIKIHKEDKIDSSVLEIVENEVNAVRVLNHPHIIKLVSYAREGEVKRKNGDLEKVFGVVVQEYA